MALEDLGGHFVALEDLGGHFVALEDLGGHFVALEDLGGHFVALEDLGGQFVALEDLGGHFVALEDLGGQFVALEELGGHFVALEDLVEIKEYGNLDFSTVFQEQWTAVGFALFHVIHAWLQQSSAFLLTVFSESQQPSYVLLLIDFSQLHSTLHYWLFFFVLLFVFSGTLREKQPYDFPLPVSCNVLLSSDIALQMCQCLFPSMESYSLTKMSLVLLSQENQ